MDNVERRVPFIGPKKYSENEANHLVDLLLNVTRKAKAEINALNSQMSCNQHDIPKMEFLQQDINEKIRRWSNKMARLGLTPLALWKVKIPNTQSSHFIWEFPQDQIQKS